MSERSPVTTPVGRPRSSRSAFWLLMRQVAIVAGLTHLAFIGLFWALGAPVMSLINVGSVAMFGASVWCLKRRLNTPAVMLIFGELMLHAVLAVRTLGWDSGFHYYLLVAAPVVMMGRRMWPGFKPLTLGLLLATYLGLDHWTHHQPPWDVVPANVLTGVRAFNVVCTFGLLSFLAHSYLSLIRQAESAMHQLATTDPLTHLLNRRSLRDQAVERVQQADDGLAFILADLDHFKAINDVHGHAAGDAVLVAVSAALKEAVREQDIVARWGGEEFLIMMPGADLPTAMAIAERLRQTVATIHVPVSAQVLQVSMTLGVSQMRAGETLDASVQRADAALYRGKEAGRNRVEAAA